MKLIISGDEAVEKLGDEAIRFHYEGKNYIILQALKEEAHKQLSYYRQKQDDLVARMATEWPTWGCTLDFYTHMVYPLLKNSLITTFINLSEGFSLDDVEIGFGYYDDGDLQFVKELFDLTPNTKSGTATPEEGSDDLKRTADLVDFALYLLTGITEIELFSPSDSESHSISEVLKEWKVAFMDRVPIPVRIRDADIGSQAFFALLEGLMRNASKHGTDLAFGEDLPSDEQAFAAIARARQEVRYEGGKLVVTEHLTRETKEALLAELSSDAYKEALTRLFDEVSAARHEKGFRVKIVYCDRLEDVKQLVDFGNYEIAPSEKHGFVIISASRDMIKDPLSGEHRKVAGEPIVEYLRDQFREGIIDATGKINPGNWGIKEIKTCAAFLAGESLYAVNELNPKFILVGYTCASRGEGGIWEDARERICYIIRIEKPRLAIALIPREKLPENPRLWKAVRFAHSTSDVFAESVDYDFLYIDESLRDPDQKFINENWHILPQRVVYGDFSFNSESKTEGMCIEEEFTLELYNKTIYDYLAHLGDESEIRLGIYFEDDGKAKAWEDAIKNRIQLGRNKRITLDFIKMLQTQFDRGYTRGYQIVIFRHTYLSQEGIVGRQRGERKGSFIPYYAQQVSGADPFFSFLMAIDPEENYYLANLILRQVIEATLLNILIIDERIAQALQGMRAKDDPEILLSEKLYWMGIHVAGSISVDDEKLWATDHADDRLVDVSIKDGKIQNTVTKKVPFNILFIHATRLNEIFNRLQRARPELTKEQFISDLQDAFNSVIVHSGRGKTEGDIPESTPFLEYSTLEKHVLNEPSKFYLVQIALNVKGVRK